MLLLVLLVPFMFSVLHSLWCLGILTTFPSRLLNYNWTFSDSNFDVFLLFRSSSRLNHSGLCVLIARASCSCWIDPPLSTIRIETICGWEGEWIHLPRLQLPSLGLCNALIVCKGWLLSEGITLYHGSRGDNYSWDNWLIYCLLELFKCLLHLVSLCDLLTFRFRGRWGIAVAIVVELSGLCLKIDIS